MDLGRDRHLREEGAVPGQPGRAAAVAALDVFDDVEDLLPLHLPSHPPDVQDGRHMLLPEWRQKVSQKTVELVVPEEPGPGQDPPPSGPVVHGSATTLIQQICFSVFVIEVTVEV